MSYVFAGYGITLAAIAAYTWHLLWRERSLRRSSARAGNVRQDQSS